MFRARRIARRRAIVGKRADAERNEQAREAEDGVSLPDPAGRLEDLSELREQGILTEEEFAAEKKRLLGA
ncbi:MAG: SHOCT domain-containing protein [Gaiellaceae bacterium]